MVILAASAGSGVDRNGGRAAATEALWVVGDFEFCLSTEGVFLYIFCFLFFFFWGDRFTREKRSESKAAAKRRALWRYEQRNVYGAIQKPCERSYGQLDAEFVTIHFGSLPDSTSTAAAAAIRKMAAQPVHMSVPLLLAGTQAEHRRCSLSLSRSLAWWPPRCFEWVISRFECLS